ncbi:STAS domain-containing protein [candidate division KSB1 bacterium]|nr:STAS domain-containing protein [candidate division KSB1 bacterium]
MEGIQLSVKQAGIDNNISIIKVGGYIDTTTSAELEHSLDQLLNDQKHRIIIDLKDVDYISSAGWGIFISEIKGIREKGGDLKLVGMISDVYEVFELLEFHYIIKSFETIEEAIVDFDKGRPMAEVSAPAPAPQPQRTPVSSPAPGPAPHAPVEENRKREEYLDKMVSGEAKDTGIEEKIKQLIIENPENGSIKIMKELKTAKYGNVKLGWFQVIKYLKKMDLNSKKKRVEYFKTQAFK